MSTLSNPVLPGFFPDPACAGSATTTTSRVGFEYFPGVPIHHSTDLVDWTLVGNALDRPEQLPLAGARSSGGIYAPTLRHHGGLFSRDHQRVSAGARDLHRAGPARSVV